MSKSTSAPIVSSMGRALEHARRAVLPANAVFLTRSVRADLIGFAVDREIVGGVVVKGTTTAAVPIRSVEGRKAIVNVDAEWWRGEMGVRA